MGEEDRMADPLVRTNREIPGRLKKRRDFLHAAGGRKSHSALFTIQARSQAEPVNVPRVGLTVTKKVGNAVERNRIKRRLREALRSDTDLQFAPTHDYVIVARRPLLSVPFDEIGAGLRSGLTKAHSGSRLGAGRTHGQTGQPRRT